MVQGVIRFEPGAGQATSARVGPKSRLETEIGYGFAGGDGVVTPHAGMTLAAEGSRRYRLGGRFVLGPTLSVNLEGARQESETAAPDHSVMLRGRLRG